MICVRERGRYWYFDQKCVLSIEEPVDIPSGRKPCGWMDEYAAIVCVGFNGSVIHIPIIHAEWPAVRLALGLDSAVHVTAPLHG